MSSEEILDLSAIENDFKYSFLSSFFFSTQTFIFHHFPILLIFSNFHIYRCRSIMPCTWSLTRLNNFRFRLSLFFSLLYLSFYNSATLPPLYSALKNIFLRKFTLVCHSVSFPMRFMIFLLTLNSRTEWSFSILCRVLK